MTNLERIKGLSEAEIADLLVNTIELHLYYCQDKTECEDYTTITDEKCKQCALEWLRSEGCIERKQIHTATDCEFIAETDDEDGQQISFY